MLALYDHFTEAFTSRSSDSICSINRLERKDYLMTTFDLGQTADFLKVSSCTAQEMAASGELPGAKIGRAWVFLEEDLIDWLRGQIKIQQLTRQEQHPILSEVPLSPAPRMSRKTRRRTLPKLPELPSQV